MLVKSQLTKEIQLAYADVEPLGNNGGRVWKHRLVRRRHRFPAAGATGEYWAVRLDHDDESCFFPLGTADEDTAAAKAGHIYDLIMQHGWKTVCAGFSREFMVSFEWSLHPLLWTYSTIHTVIGDAAGWKADPLPEKNAQRVLVVEADAGIRRALCRGISRQAPFAGIPCESVESCRQALTVGESHLVLLNRKLAGWFGVAPGNLTTLENGTRVLTYSAHADGDQMFAATPADAESCLIKPLRPDRLLEPLLPGHRPPGPGNEDLHSNIKAYFRAALQSGAPKDSSALEKLSRREREVLGLLSKGQVDKEIARGLGISVWTVHGYVKSIFERLKVHTRTEAVVRYLEK